MPNYKISVSKENKRYTIIFKADNEVIARDRVHKEGYSILGVEEIENQEHVGNTFIFEGFKGGELKHGKIAGDDIFKVYVNLVKNLEYDVVYIYFEGDKDISAEKKEKIIKELKEEYNLVYGTGKKEKIDELREKIKKEKGEKLNLDQFYMKKELEETNKLIVHVLTKLEAMILGNSTVKLDFEQKQKLETIYNSIIKLKKSTNISKLKEIGELALQKIGKLELSNLEETKNEKSRELLKETNKLLKEIGSKEKFIEKEKDLKYQFGKMVNYMKTNFSKKEEKNKNKVEEIDKESHSYVKTQLFLSKYEEKLRENNIYILKNLFKFLFNSELREMNDVKRSVIKQNIFIYKSKLKGKAFSYSMIAKGFGGFFGGISDILEFIRQGLFVIIFLFTIIFLIFLNLGYSFNYTGLFLFLSFILAYILLSITKKLFFVIPNFALFGFIIILGVINF